MVGVTVAILGIDFPAIF